MLELLKQGNLELEQKPTIIMDAGTPLGTLRGP